MKKNIFKSGGFQSLLASLLCIVLGLFLGYLVLLLINPAGAGEAILTVIKNFMTYNRPASQLKYFGNTLVKTAPLLMCALAILFAYKVGLFNIGAAGQYCAGVALSLYAALGLGWSWLPCMLLAICGGAILGGISGLLKSYCNVNEVISGIMLNWIVLYLTNMLLTTVKEDASPYTKVLAHINESAVLPSLGLGALFNNNQYVGLAIPLSVLMAILVWVVLEKTKFGYELKATGYNKNAAKYCGMAEKRNIILTLMISGALAAIFTQMLPGLAMFDVLLSSTTVSEFIGAMDGFHISKKFSVPVSVMFRFFPTIREEYGMIRDALRLRGVGGLGHPLEMLEYRMVPLLTELMQVGNELSASAMTRGLDTPGKRSNVCPMGFRVQDIVVFLLCVAVIALFIFAKVTGR